MHYIPALWPFIEETLKQVSKDNTSFSSILIKVVSEYLVSFLAVLAELSNAPEYSYFFYLLFPHLIGSTQSSQQGLHVYVGRPKTSLAFSPIINSSLHADNSYLLTVLTCCRQRLDPNRSAKSMPGTQIIFCTIPKLEFLFERVLIPIPCFVILRSVPSPALLATQATEGFRRRQGPVVFK